MEYPNRRHDVRVRDYVRLRAKFVEESSREVVKEQIALERLSSYADESPFQAPRVNREVWEHMELPGVNIMNLFYALDAKLDAIMAFLIERDIEQRWGGLVPVDIGAAGIRFASDERFDVKRLLRLEIMLQCMPPQRIITLAEVLRDDDDDPAWGANKPYRVATKFIDLDPVDRDRIVKRIFDVQRMLLRREREAKDAAADPGEAS